MKLLTFGFHFVHGDLLLPDAEQLKVVVDSLHMTQNQLTINTLRSSSDKTNNPRKFLSTVSQRLKEQQVLCLW